MRCSGRSVAMVRPCSWRDRPTAKSQMSIISWTSPRPSERILPASMETRRPSASLWARSSSPSSRTSSPRWGAGTLRQARKAAWAVSIARRASASVGWRSWAMISPEIGEDTERVPPLGRGRPPQGCRAVFLPQAPGWRWVGSSWGPQRCGCRRCQLGNPSNSRRKSGDGKGEGAGR